MRPGGVSVAGAAPAGRPAGAVRVGFADETAAPDAVVARAEVRLAELAALPAAAYAANKRRLRGDEGAGMLTRLEPDVAGLIAAFHATLT